MRILLICKVYPTARPGGMGFVCQDRARELVRQGHEVHVVTTPRKHSTPVYGQSSEDLDDQGVQVHHVQGEPGEYGPNFAYDCHSWVNKILPEIVHLDSFDNNRPWWREIKGQCRLGLTLHGFSWGAYFTKVNLLMRKEINLDKCHFDLSVVMREREYMLDFHTVIGISLHEQWMLRQLMGIDQAKLVYNPIPDYFFTPTRLIPADYFLCAAVSGHGERGFRYAEEAAKKAGVELKTIKDVPRDKVPALLDRSLGLVLPTAYAQGCDLAVGEAIARMRPVIVTATGSYLREAAGAYAGALQLVPVVDPVPALVAAMKNPITPDWENVQQVHKVSEHVAKWLELMQP